MILPYSAAAPTPENLRSVRHQDKANCLVWIKMEEVIQLRTGRVRLDANRRQVLCTTTQKMNQVVTYNRKTQRLQTVTEMETRSQLCSLRCGQMRLERTVSVRTANFSRVPKLTTSSSNFSTNATSHFC